MAHERARHILKQLKKKAKLWPVVGLLGARQTGKSTLLRQQLQKILAAKYLVMDRKSIRTQAENAPEHFITSQSNSLKIPLILDEVQRVPDLFEAIKVEVDERRIPGRFLISGSTEFSKRTGIRESLTGRIGTMHLFPFTIAEILELSFANPWVSMKPSRRCSSADLESYFEKGGMPGACFLRNDEERKEYFEGWLDTTCFRDLQQVKGVRLEGSLAMDILYALARLQNPSITMLKRDLHGDPRKLQKHLEGLEALFVIHSVDPHPLGIGKRRYFIFDCGLARYLGASMERCRSIWAMNECLAQYEYSGLARPKINYFESKKHAFVDWVIDDRKVERAVLISDEEVPHEFRLRSLGALREKNPKIALHVLAPVHELFEDESGIVHLPWRGMA